MCLPTYEYCVVPITRARCPSLPFLFVSSFTLFPSLINYFSVFLPVSHLQFVSTSFPSLLLAYLPFTFSVSSFLHFSHPLFLPPFLCFSVPHFPPISLVFCFFSLSFFISFFCLLPLSLILYSFISSCVRFFRYLSLPFIYFSASYFLSLTHSCLTYSFLSLSLYRYIVFCFAIFSVSASGIKTAFAKNTTVKPSYNKIIFWDFVIGGNSL